MNAGPIRILHVLAPARYGGLERVVLALGRAQAQRGHSVRIAVVTDHPTDHPFIAALQAARLEVTAIQTKRRAYWREYQIVRGLIRSFRADVVHTHGYRVDIVAGRAARAERVPCVTTSHGFSRGSWRNRLYEWVQRREFRRFDAVIAVSRPMAERLRQDGVSARRLYVVQNALADEMIYNRLQARQKLGIPADELRIGWIGRLAWAKAVDVFIASLARITDAPWTASIIGTGAMEAAARSLAHKLGIADRISWHGHVDDAGRLLSAFDMIVISSRTEGTPITLLEAMRARVPIITTAVGGIPDVVSADEAWLVPPLAPDAIAACIRQVRERPHEARARSVAASRRLEDFGSDRWIEKHEVIYEALTAEFRSVR